MWTNWLPGRAPWDLPSRRTWLRIERADLALALGAVVTALAAPPAAQLAAGIGLLLWLTHQLDRHRRAGSMALFLATLSRRDPSTLARSSGELARRARDPRLRAMLLGFWAHAALRAGELEDAAKVARRLQARGWTPRTWLASADRARRWGPDALRAASGVVCALALAGALDAAAAALRELEEVTLDRGALTLPTMLVRALEGDDAAVLSAWAGARVPAEDQAAACWLASRAQLRASRSPYRLDAATREPPAWLERAWPDNRPDAV